MKEQIRSFAESIIDLGTEKQQEVVNHLLSKDEVLLAFWFARELPESVELRKQLLGNGGPEVEELRASLERGHWRLGCEFKSKFLFY